MELALGSNNRATKKTKYKAIWEANLETANLVRLAIKKNTMLVFEERLKMPVDN